MIAAISNGPDPDVLRPQLETAIAGQKLLLQALARERLAIANRTRLAERRLKVLQMRLEGEARRDGLVGQTEGRNAGDAQA